MFLKTRSTNNAAKALDFDLLYESQPNWQTYKSLLQMAKVCFYEIKHLNPKDFRGVVG